MMTDLAVPLSPTKMTGNLFVIIKFRMYENLRVSTVGTSIFENFLPSGSWNFLIYSVSFQCFHCLLSAMK